MLVRLKVSPSAAAVALGFPHGRAENERPAGGGPELANNLGTIAGKKIGDETY